MVGIVGEGLYQWAETEAEGGMVDMLAMGGSWSFGARKIRMGEGTGEVGERKSGC
jgi:hypothetical protein